MANLVYTLSFSTAVTAQQDLFEIVPASSALVVLHQVILSQSSGSTSGLRLAFKRGMTTTGSGGTTPTPVPISAKFPAAGSTVKANNTTKSTAGTIVTLHNETWYTASPFVWLPTPELRPVIGPSVRFAIELATTPGASTTIDGTLYFEEVG